MQARGRRAAGRARAVRAGAAVGRARRLPHRGRRGRASRGRAARGAARTPAPRRSTFIWRRASRRASSSPAARSGATTSSGSCSAAIVAAGAAVLRRLRALRRQPLGSRRCNARERAELQTREARAATQQYERITATFPVTQTTTENLRVTVVEFRRIARAQRLRPSAAFAHASRVLERFPQMEIDTHQLERAASPASSAAPNRAPRRAVTQTRRAGRAPPCSSPSRAGSTRRSATTTAASPRRCSASPRRWRAAGYELARTQLPFDITSEGTLTGDIGARRIERGAALHHRADAEAAVTFTARRAAQARTAARSSPRRCSPPAAA